MLELTPVLITGIVFGTIIFIIKTVSDHTLRKRLIETGKVDEHAKILFTEPNKPGYHPLSSIKWGMVLIGLGVALLLGNLYPSYFSEEATFGLMLFLAGLAFIIYYFIAKNKLEEE